MSTEDRLPTVPTFALGMLTIVAFGVWLYGFGVLIEPIANDTGWNESTLGGAYGASLLVTGIFGTGIGRALDNRGSRVTFAALGISSAAFLFLMSLATHPAAFIVLAAVSGGLIGAGGYYTATAAVMARIAPTRRAQGITRVTLFGAFSSPIALPIIAAAATTHGWRPTVRGMALAIGVAYLACAIAVPDVAPAVAERTTMRSILGSAAARGAPRNLLLAGVMGGAATSLIIVQQVPAMTEGGMALSVASGFAGARGVLQLLGRLPLPPVISRLGSRTTLAGSHLLSAAGALLLINAGSFVQASAFAIVAGVSLGAFGAVEGIYAAEVHDGPAMATLLGLFGLAKGMGAAVGPFLGGVLVDVTGARVTALAMSFACSLVAAAALRTREPEPVPA